MAEVQHGAEALHCVSSLAQGGELDEAADLIRNECSEASPSALAAVRQTVIEGYIQQDQLESACAFALEALRLPNGWEQLTMTSAEQLLRALLHGQLHGRAVELLQGLCQPGASAPSDQVFNSMLDSTVRTRSYGEAWDVLELLLKCGRKADKYFVSILTKSLEASNDKRWVRRGISLVDKFIEQQREDVDEIVFNSLLNVLGQTGDMQKLQQTLNKMNDYGVAPSAVTFGTVVKAYGRARDTESVIKVWNQMRSRCLGINPVTCGCVLDACVKCNSLDKAMAIFQEMRMQGMHKNTVLYATLIKGLAKVRDLQGAMNLYHEMRMEGVPCNLVTFNSLMDVCVRCGDLQTAAYFLQDMMGMGIDPDLITFSTLIKGYSHIGEVHKALALSKELKARGLKCDEIMYNSLIDGCAKARKVSEGLAVFEEMLQSRVQPSNITFSILVKLHFEVGQIAEAFRLVEDMPKHRCMPGRIVYTVLLRCSCQTGRPALAQAAQLLIDLSRKNSKLPDQVMVSSLLSACVQHSDFDSIGRLVREFATGSRRSSSVGLENLKHCFEALGSLNEELGKELLEYLRSRSAPASHISILEAAIQMGKENPGWSSAVDTGCEQEGSTEGVQQYPNQAYAPAGMMQMPPMCPDMYGWDQTGYAHGQNPYYAQYTEAAAAAACAATAAYNQHMARFAAQAAAAYPQFSIMPPFLPSLKMEMPPMAPDAAWVPTLPAPPAVPAPALPAEAAPMAPTVAPAQNPVPLPPMPKGPALTPLPAGPVSPKSAMASEKQKATNKENTRYFKEKAGGKVKGRIGGYQNKENIQGQDVHEVGWSGD